MARVAVLTGPQLAATGSSGCVRRPGAALRFLRSPPLRLVPSSSLLGALPPLFLPS